MEEGKKMIVRYANELARKYSKLTLEEQKVLHLIFSQIKPFEKNPTTFKIEKIDFFKKLNLKGDDKYRTYSKLLKNLINKSIIEIDDEIKTSIGIVICNVEWYKKESFFQVYLNPMFMPYIEQLVRDYTKVNLDSILKLKSKHALTLYKFICSWTDEKKLINQRYQTTKELKKLLGLTIDDYVYNGKFKRYEFERDTINVAINEINEKTDINVRFKKNKEHNKVKNYQFNWNLKSKEVKFTVVDDKKTPTNNISGADEECSILHKNMYEENDCEKIHTLNNYNNSLNRNNIFDDYEDIVWD